MNDINATIGLYNLPHIDALLIKNRNNGNYYNEQLKDITGIQLLHSHAKCNSAYWLYTIRVLHDKKIEFINFMKEKGIMTSQVHNRNDINTCVLEYKEVLPKLDILEKEIVSIPVGWWLTDENKKYIIECIKCFFNQ